MEGIYRKETNSKTEREVDKMYNEKSRKNLKKFSSKNQPKKKGRPKGSLSITNEIKKVLESVDPASKKPICKLLAVAATRQAIKGNAPYFKEIVDRIDGKITDKMEYTLKGRGPVEVKVIYED
jgi:hypothetical protein